MNAEQQKWNKIAFTFHQRCFTSKVLNLWRKHTSFSMTALEQHFIALIWPHLVCYLPQNICCLEAFSGRTGLLASSSKGFHITASLVLREQLPKEGLCVCLQIAKIPQENRTRRWSLMMQSDQAQREAVLIHSSHNVAVRRTCVFSCFTSFKLRPMKRLTE